MASASFNTITVADTATEILEARGERRGYIIQNISKVNVYIGSDNTITSSNTVFLGPGEKFMSGSLSEGWLSAVFGIVETGTAEVRFWEWGQGN